MTRHRCREVDDWIFELRAWLRRRPVGSVFRSRDVFQWVAEGGVPLIPAEQKPISASGRSIWRARLSCALRRLHERGELEHPGISRHAWRIL